MSADRWVLVPRELLQSCIDSPLYMHERIQELKAALAAAPAAPAAEPVATDPDGWEANAAYLLDRCPFTVRQRPGGGSEDLMASLVVTFMGMQHRLTALWAAPAAEPDNAAWFALVTNAAASIEDAAACLRDPDAKRQAEGAMAHFRAAAQKLYAGAAPAAESPEPQPLTMPTDERIEAAIAAWFTNEERTFAARMRAAFAAAIGAPHD
jgi:hypothetical protein